MRRYEEGERERERCSKGGKCWNENCIVDKGLGLGQGPEFRVGKFVVIFRCGAAALPLYSGARSGQGCEVRPIKGYKGLTKEYFDSLDWESWSIKCGEQCCFDVLSQFW